MRRETLGYVLCLLLILGGGAQGASWIVISEIMYHPPDPGEHLEFIELYLCEPPRVDLSGWRLEGEVSFDFPPGTVLLPGQYLVVARDPERLRAARPAEADTAQPAEASPPARSPEAAPLRYDGRLDNGGGRIRLVNPMGTVATQVRYDDDGAWPSTPDGTGHSLSLIDPLFDLEDPRSWAPSPKIGGTPGKENGFGAGPGRMRVPPRPPVSINEVKGGAEPFIELYNVSPQAVDLAGYYITDAPAEPKRYAFPAGARIEGGAYLLLRREAFDSGFSIPEEKARVALTAPEGDRVIDFFTADGKGSHGRYPDGTGEVLALTSPSPGRGNEPLRKADLVVSEIMYHPISEDDDDEYIEIHNRGAEALEMGGFVIRGGISFTFPKSARIGGRGYVVVAKNPTALRSRYGSFGTSTVFGPYGGVLADGGETLRLEDDAGRLIDEVTYSDRHPWSRWADGMGSSLELVNLEGENDLAAAWRPSEDRGEAKWKRYTYVGQHRAFAGRNVSEFQLMLLGEGECLIDDVRLLAEGELIDDGSFEHGAPGWNAFGTHARSDVTAEDSQRGRKAYRIVADGRGNTRYNYVAAEVRRDLVPGKLYRLVFRAKWQRGCVDLLTRSSGQGVARVQPLEVPKRLGSPGAENSVAGKYVGPAVGVPQQSPVVPAAGKPVEIEVRVDSSIKVTGAKIHYRRDGDAEWTRLPMARTPVPVARGTSLWRGTIPGQQEGLMEYYIEAVDERGQFGLYPLDAPARTALYLVGLKAHERLPTYTLLVTKHNRDTLDRWRQDPEKRAIHSNRMFDATLVYGDSRIFYNVRFRWRGSPFTRSSHNWRIQFGEECLTGLGSFNLDGQRQDGTRQKERIVHWMLSQLEVPSVRQRYVHFNFHGRESGTFEEVERINGDYLRRWFKGKGRGNLYKVDDHFEFVDGRRVNRDAFLKFQGKDPELYRWNFQPRATGTTEDFRPFIEFVALMDPAVTSNQRFLGSADKMVNVDEWLRVLAVRTFVDDWDTLGRDRGKNAYLYRTPGKEGRWSLIAWDSDLTFRNAKAGLFSNKFASIQRLLAVSPYRHQFLSYVAYLARGPCQPENLKPILADTSAVCGSDASAIMNFSTARCEFVIGQTPLGRAFAVHRVRRIGGRGEVDRLRVEGTTPTGVARFLADGRRGEHHFLPGHLFVAEFPVGPEGGNVTIAAEGFGGKIIGHDQVQVSTRKDALPLRPARPEPSEAEPPPTPVVAKATVVMDLGKGRIPHQAEEPKETKETGEAKETDVVTAEPSEKPGPEPSEARKVVEPEPVVAQEVKETASGGTAFGPGDGSAFGPKGGSVFGPGRGSVFGSGQSGTGPSSPPRSSVFSDPPPGSSEPPWLPARKADTPRTVVSRTEPPSPAPESAGREEARSDSLLLLAAGLVLGFLAILGGVIALGLRQWRRIGGDREAESKVPVPSAARVSVAPRPARQPPAGRADSFGPIAAARPTAPATRKAVDPFGPAAPARAAPRAKEGPGVPLEDPFGPVTPARAAPRAKEGPGVPLEDPFGPAEPVRPAPRPAKHAEDPLLRELARDLERLGSPDFGVAAAAFNRLQNAGHQAIPVLRKGQTLRGKTPFAKIRRGPSGFTPVPSGGSQSLPLRAVVNFLLKNSSA